MTFTLNEVAILLLVALAGLVLGLMISGRGKYRRYWRDEQRAHARTIEDRDTRLSAAHERIAELERQSGPIGVGTARAVSGAVDGRDDLSRIHGITAEDEIGLNEAGYLRFAQIAAIEADQEAILETRLGLRPGVISKEEWREQARLLDGRKDEEHARLFQRRITRD